MAKRHYDGLRLGPVPIDPERSILDGSLTDCTVKINNGVTVDPYDYGFGSGTFDGAGDTGYDVTFD